MLPIHPIKYHRSGQNAGRRAKSGTSHTRQRSDGTNLFRCFNQMRIGKQYTCMLGAYITKKLAIQSSYSIYFQAQATLNEPATVNVINFQAVVKRKGLVSSSYTSAAELSTAITDRLREQWGATQIPGSSQATYTASSEQCTTVNVSNSHFITTAYGSVELASAAKYIHYFVSRILNISSQTYAN